MAFQRIAIIGANGSIGHALVSQLATNSDHQVYALARDKTQQLPDNVCPIHIDYSDESSIARAAKSCAETAPLDLVIVTCGILHNAELQPEKSYKNLEFDNMQKVFTANTFVPALVAKYFLPTLNKHNRTVFAAISARVGSISDNRLGGWYSYRASKAALNMIIKNAAIETNRLNKNAIVVGLHPGTVDSALSKPFQANVPADKLFTPSFSANKLISVINQLTENDSGQCFAWDGQAIPA